MKNEPIIRKISDFAPEGTESGVGLALQDDVGFFLFFLAGTRHKCPPGELFYAGIGGHREEGEDWVECAHREALEEIGTDIDIIPSPMTWYVPKRGPVQKVEISDIPQPFALYEMIHPPDTLKASGLYHIVIYKARTHSNPRNLPTDEVQGVIALTTQQVIQGLNNRLTLSELLEDGAVLVAGGEHVNRQVQLYPLGTARALGQIFTSIKRS